MAPSIPPLRRSQRIRQLLPIVDMSNVTSSVSDSTPASSSATLSTTSSTSSAASLSAATTPETDVNEEIVSPMARELLQGSTPTTTEMTTTSRTPAVPLERFLIFSHLPLEIRRMIWRFAINQPRVLAYYCNWSSVQVAKSGWNHMSMSGQTLHIRWVCHDAREEAKLFEVPFMRFTPPNRISHVDQGHLINPVSDTIFFHERRFGDELGLYQMLLDLVEDCDPKPKIRTLAMPYVWHQVFFGGLQQIEEMMLCLKAMGTEELVFVTSSDDTVRRSSYRPHLTTAAEGSEPRFADDLIKDVKKLLKMKKRNRVTWDHLAQHDLIRIEEAKEISDTPLDWGIKKVSFKEMSLLPGR